MTGQCVCGHFKADHLHSAGMCLAITCGCERLLLDDGTDGSTTNPGPRWDSDLYQGKYGIDQRFGLL